MAEPEMYVITGRGGDRSFARVSAPMARINATGQLRLNAAALREMGLAGLEVPRIVLFWYRSSGQIGLRPYREQHDPVRAALAMKEKPNAANSYLASFAGFARMFGVNLKAAAGVYLLSRDPQHGLWLISLPKAASAPVLAPADAAERAKGLLAERIARRQDAGTA